MEKYDWIYLFNKYREDDRFLNISDLTLKRLIKNFNVLFYIPEIKRQRQDYLNPEGWTYTSKHAADRFEQYSSIEKFEKILFEDIQTKRSFDLYNYFLFTLYNDIEYKRKYYEKDREVFQNSNKTQSEEDSDEFFEGEKDALDFSGPAEGLDVDELDFDSMGPEVG